MTVFVTIRVKISVFKIPTAIILRDQIITKFLCRKNIYFAGRDGECEE